MNDEYPQYELLAKYLDPQFGNIYEYNMKPGQVAGFDFQDWTDDLRRAVKHFLLHELPADLWDYLAADPFEDAPGGTTTKEAKADKLIERLQPAEVALMVRNAAVVAVPTLHQLIGHFDDWPSEDERGDAETWLESLGDTVDWRALVAATDHHELFIRLREALKDEPAGGSLVAWLDEVIAKPAPRKRDSAAEPAS